MNTLVLDVGGTHVKLLLSGRAASREFESGPKLTPGAMVEGVQKLARDWQWERVAIGYPGVVVHGRIVAEPKNLGSGWVGFDFGAAFGCEVKLINDAAMQALGDYRGGSMLFLGLGTGLGTAMVVDGRVEPMELAHLPYKKGRSYEDYVGAAALKKRGAERWQKHVWKIVALLRKALQPDEVVMGGGNAARLKDPPPGVRLSDNSAAFTGGFRLWDAPAATTKTPPPTPAPQQTQSDDTKPQDTKPQGTKPQEHAMKLGMIGLGRMGGSMARRLMAAGHELVVHDHVPEAIAPLASDGAVGAGTLEELVANLPAPRAVWLMVPAAVVDSTIEALAPLLAAGDTVIDGGNSYYIDDIRRARALAERGLHYLDVGTSGGVWGQERGYCLMIGGERAPVVRLDPIFAALAPDADSAPRTPGREGRGGTAEHGYLHCGPAGAGHFVKMVHNGIEYGIMASYAEGLSVLQHANVGASEGVADAETTPLRDPELYRYKLDLPEITEVWRRGSVIASWLLDLSAEALLADPQLDAFAGRVSDSGEGRWTIKAAIDEAVPVPVLSAALYQRFSSRGEAEYADKLLSAMRSAFGGHHEKS